MATFTYDPTTPLGRLRELLGDTDFDSHLYSDLYLNNLLATHKLVEQAAIVALHRLLSDPDMLVRRYSRFGRLTPPNVIQLKRIVLDQIRSLENIGKRLTYQNKSQPKTSTIGEHLHKQEAR